MKKIKIKKKVKNNSSSSKSRKIKNIIINSFMVMLIFVSSAILIFALYIIISAPNFDKDLLYKKEATVLYDINGKEITRIGSENRVVVSYEDLPQVFIDALLATEDSRFFQHNGLDIARFMKASFNQLLGRNAGGASTITMQVIKNTYTSLDATGIKGLIRKFTDIYMAVFKLENCYTKEEILEFYSNILWLGYDGNLNYSGIYGIEQASQYYFGKSVSELSLAEASLIVGMHQNARVLNPYKNPEGCRERQNTVLTLMVNHGYITKEQKEAVLAIPVESMLSDENGTAEASEYQAFIDYALEEAQRKTGKNPYDTPMQIYTTLNPKVQDVLVKMETGELFGKDFKWYNEFDQEGTAITSIENGSIVALSGGRNYVAKGTNRATDIKRQPGSTAKPLFDYAPYIEYLNGSTGDYLFDEPYTYTNGTPITDADKKYQGMITMRQSLVGSRNVTALQVFQKVANKDISLIEDFVHSVGIDYGSTLYESASIGGFDGVSPLEMSAAYAIFARKGYFIEPYSITKVIFDDGTSYEYKLEKEKVLSEEAAYMITSMLIDAVRDNWSGYINVRGTQVAGKTGTTTIDKSALESKGLPASAIMDSWSITYSPEYCISLWYGYDELSKEYYMNTDTGWTARSRIMEKLAANIYSTNKTFSRPSGVVSVEVEKYTIPLQLASEHTPEDMRITELFKEGTEPTEVSTRFAKLDKPSNGRFTYDSGTVTLTWDEIKTPDAVNNTYLENNFKKYYGQFANKFLEERIKENEDIFGKLGYQIYLKDSSGNLNNLSWSETNNYTYAVEGGSNYTFVIKSSYQTFKANASDGLEIKVTTLKDEPASGEVDTPQVPNQTPNNEDLD